MNLGDVFYQILLAGIAVGKLGKNCLLYTSIGTGINSEPEYAELCARDLRIISGEEFVLAPNLIAATPDTGACVSYSSELKRFCVQLSKVCNDLRLLSSGPRCGLNEINLPPMQPGSSITVSYTHLWG